MEGGVAYTKSNAALRIAAHLPAPYSYLPWTAIVPACLRDAVYSCVATNRYRWFGQSEECMRPTPDNLARFLDAAEMVPKRRPKPAVVAAAVGSGAGAAAGAPAAAKKED